MSRIEGARTPRLLFLFTAGTLAMILLACGGSSSEGEDPKNPFVPMPAPPSSSGEAPPIDPAIFPQPGTTDFTTANERELLSNGTSPGYNKGYNGRSELDSAADGAGAAEPAPGAPPQGPAPQPEATPDVNREIVEADVYKLEGDLLYVLNRYRGLVIIDVSDPDKMFVRGRLPFQSMPVEMYVREGRAYVVSSDYFVYWQYDPEADPHGFHGSQVLIADVTNPDKPAKLGSVHVDGEVTDTRMVGDVLYAVSKRRPDYWRYNTADWEDRTWIVSLNIKDPKNIKEVDRVTFSGMSTLLHVAHHAIFVAAWDPNFYLTSPDLEQETLVTYVDISDPAGKLKQRGKVYIPGAIADKFKMNWHDGHFRVLSHQRRSTNTVKLHVVKTEFPDKLKIDASLELTGIKYSGLRATRYDGDRAFVFTQDYDSYLKQQRRWLHSLDLSQALSPKLAGKIEVDHDSTHIEIHGDRLLVLGSHYIYQNSYPKYDRRVATILYDVSNLGAVKQLALARLGEGYSSSEANHDYKAFKSFPKLELLLVPLNYWDPGTKKSFAGVQLVDWKNDTLTERGRVGNTGGVRRAFPVKNRLVAVGEMALASIDAQDRDQPKVTSQLKLVHRVHDVYDVKGLQVQLVTDAYTQQVRLEVRNFGAEDDSPTLATLDLPFKGAPFVLRDGDIFHLIGRDTTTNNQVVRNADLTNPKSPKLRGDFTLSNEFHTVFHPGWGWYQHYWSPNAGLPLNNRIVPATFRKVVEGAGGRREWESELRFLDLSDTDDPKMASGTVPMNDFPFINKVTHGDVLYSTHVEQATSPDGASLLYHVRAYVDRVDVSDPNNPKLLPPVNIPGYLVDVSDDGKLWYTVDFQWDDFGRRRNSLNVLKLVAPDKVELISVIPVADQINRAALRPGQLSENGGKPTGWNDRTIWLTAHKYPWWGVKSDTVSSRQPYTIMRRLDFAKDGTVQSEQKASLDGYHFDLLDVEGSMIYLASRGPTGLLVVDVSDMSQPKIAHTARTLNYLSRIVVHGSHAYAPLGMYGVHRY